MSESAQHAHWYARFTPAVEADEKKASSSSTRSFRFLTSLECEAVIDSDYIDSANTGQVLAGMFTEDPRSAACTYR
eukprot:2719028-Prymnesium_polylepis.1